MAMTVGSRTTQTAITTEARQVRNVAPTIYELDPNIAPFVTFTGKMKKRVKTDSPRVEFLMDDYTEIWDTVGSGGIDASATTLPVTHQEYFTVGDVVAAPRLNTADPSGQELFLVTAKAAASGAGNLTVHTRAAFNSGSPAGTGLALAAGRPLKIIGQAFAEGSDIPIAKTTTTTTGISYTQIFKRTLDLTGTVMATKQYGDGGNERTRQQNKLMREMKREINSAYLWGKASEALTFTGGPLRTTMGLNSVITTNASDAGGTLTPKFLNNFARTAFLHGSTKKLLLVPAVFVNAVNAWQTNHLQVSQKEIVFGVSVNVITTAFGEWMMVYDRMLEDIVAATGYGGTAFSIDMDYIEGFWLQYGGENRDIKWQYDVVKTGADKKVDLLQGEIGIKVIQEKNHAKLYNISDFAS